MRNCPQGHPYDEVNTYLTPDNKRQCRICKRDRTQRWRDENQEKYRTSNARSVSRYKDTHSEEIKIQQAAWREDNRDKVKATAADYYQAHLESKKAYQAAWRTTNPEYDTAYRVANPDTVRNIQATRRARKLNQFVEDVDRQVVFERDQGLCGICSGAVDQTDWHLDHIQPLSRGGEHSYDNTQVSHPICNRRKGAAYADV